METKKIIAPSFAVGLSNRNIIPQLADMFFYKNVCNQKLTVIISLRILLLLLSLLAFTQMPAQKIWEERKGCVRMQGNLAPGFLFSQKMASAYINGDMDLFLDNRVSFTGSVWYSFALNHKNDIGLKANHAMFWGFNYHFLKPSRWDPYIGIIPGVGIVQANYRDNDILRRTKHSAVPLISASVGCNYYVGWIFHVFVKVQAVTGQAFSTLPSPVRLDELKIMAGLGWNLRLWKPKHNYMPVLIHRTR